MKTGTLKYIVCEFYPYLLILYLRGMRENINVSLIFTLLLIPLISASDGDRSPFYQNCLKSCSRANCTTDGAFTVKAAQLQDPWNRLLQWDCRDECRYHCMWRTVEGFQERGYSWPKFHGKWPFKRFLGLQEPASVLASLLNLATHAYMYNEIRRQFTVKDRSFVLFWHAFAVVCMNAWLWSIIFHARDTFFTEFMDYASALSMVMSLFVASIVRIFHKRRKLVAMISLCSLLYYIEHARYLYSGRIDYDYNMHVNIFFGASGAVLWSWWAVRRLAGGLRYPWRVLAFSLWSGAALALELLDGPPTRAWDAHALWHLATAPLPLLFYRFVIDDLKYLQKPLPSEKSDLKLT